MKSKRLTALIVGVLFIIGTVSGVLSGVFTGQIFSAPDYLGAIARVCDILCKREGSIISDPI